MLSAYLERKPALAGTDVFLLGSPVLGPDPKIHSVSRTSSTMLTVALDPDLSLKPNSVTSWMSDFGKLF